MLGWLSDARSRASVSNCLSCRDPGANCVGSTFIATSRSSRWSLARYTSPMPPAPMPDRISYGPSRVPGSRCTCLSSDAEQRHSVGQVYEHRFGLGPLDLQRLEQQLEE